MTSQNRLPGWRELALIVAIACVVFGRTALSAELLNFDDDFYFGVRNAAFVHGGLAHVLDPTKTIANVYLPVSHSSLYLDFVLFGTNPVGPHLHSLLIHALVAFALARLLARIGVGNAGAVLGAAVFLVHPALVESVAWVASRKDVLSGLFSFLCLSAVLRASRGESRQGLFAIVFALLALYSKATAVVLPLLVLPILWAARPRPWRVFAGVFALVVVVGLHHTWIAAAEGTLQTSALATRVMQVPGVFLHYLLTSLWPTGLNVMYPEVETVELFRSRFWGGVLVLGLVVGAVFALRKRRPLVAAGIAAWGLALLPFNTALPASSAAAADRYLYLALPGLVLALVGVGRRSGPILAAAALVPLMFVAAVRASDFESSEALWRSSLDAHPRNAVALVNLAIDSIERRPHELSKAEELLVRATEVARYPQHRLRAEVLLVGLTESSGRLEQSVIHAAKAVEVLDELPPGAASDSLRLDVLLKAARQARLAGEEARAAEWLATARSIGPEHPDVLAFAASARLGELIDADGRVPRGASGVDDVRSLLARADTADKASGARSYMVSLVHAEFASATGEFMAAEKFYRRAMRLDLVRPEAHLGRAQLFLGRGLFDGAETAVREAFAIGVRDPRLQYLLGLALGGLGRLNDAREYYEAYLLGRPHDQAARRALAGVLAGQAMRELYRKPGEELERIAKRILEYDPTNPKAAVIRAVAKRHARDMQGALVLLEQARERLGDDAEVLELYCKTLRDRGYECLFAERRGVAIDLFVKFLELAPAANVPTTAVGNIVKTEWSKQFQRGREALLDEDFDTAEEALRRALKIDPNEPQPRLQLGLLLFQRGGQHLDAALEEFQKNAAGLRANGGDPTLGVLYQVYTLSRLERKADAVQVADEFLAAPGEGTNDEDVARVVAARNLLAVELRDR